MIKTLRLKNFRGIKEGEIDFGPMTILLGPNNSGKTTILESLFLAPNPIRPTTYSPVFLRERGYYHSAPAIFVIHSLHETLDSEGYSIFFHNYAEKEASIEVDLNDKTHKLSFFRYQNSVFVSSNMAGNTRSYNIGNINVDCFARMSEYSARIEEHLDNNSFIDNSFYINPKLINCGYRYIENNWAKIMNLGIGKKIAFEASDFSYDNYIDITLEPFFMRQLSINAYLDDGRRIRLGDLGEGLQNFIITKMLFNIEKAKVLLWDDIESHLNPRILLNLSNWFADLIEENIQVIISTHSTEVVKIIAGLINNTDIYLLNLEKNNLTHKKMNVEEFNNLLNKGIDPRLSEGFLF